MPYAAWPFCSSVAMGLFQTDRSSLRASANLSSLAAAMPSSRAWFTAAAPPPAGGCATFPVGFAVAFVCWLGGRFVWVAGRPVGATLGCWPCVGWFCGRTASCPPAGGLAASRVESAGVPPGPPPRAR
jgi:hypothetical protein